MRSKVFLVDLIGQYSPDFLQLLKRFQPYIHISIGVRKKRRICLEKDELGKVVFLLQRHFKKHLFYYDLSDTRYYKDAMKFFNYAKENHISPIEVSILPRKKFIPPEIKGCVLLNEIFNDPKDRAFLRILLKSQNIFPEKIFRVREGKFCYYTLEQYKLMQNLYFNAPFKDRLIEKIKAFFKDRSDEK